MKALLVFLCGLSVVTGSFAQAPAAQGAAQPFTSQELNQLVGPIALYPDSLVALILPGSTVPSDIVVADRYVTQNGDPAQIPNQPWDDSVKGLTHYPDLLKWLDDNLDWTTQLGSAYLAQPDDVMDAIQQLRAQAKADGTLVNDAQQQTGTDNNGDITIEPTDPGTVYVPQYDPNAVYDDEYNTDDGPLITYDNGWPCGPWLYYWPDWRHHGIFLGDWHRWRDYHGRLGFADDGNARLWHPDLNRAHGQYQARGSSLARPAIVAPRPLAGVSIVHGKHTSPLTTTGVRATGFTSPQRDYNGRGGPVVTGPAVVERPVVVEPQERAPEESAVSGYTRGSEAREASERGQYSRQSYGVVSRPAPAPAPVYRAPVETYRPAPAPAPVFQGMSSGAGAGAAGARGAASRFGR